MTDNPVLWGWFSSDDDISHLRQRQPTTGHGNSATNNPAPVNTLSLPPTKHLPPSLPPDRTASTTDEPLRICCPQARPKQLQYSAGRERIWTQFQGWRTWGDMNERWWGRGQSISRERERHNQGWGESQQQKGATTKGGRNQESIAGAMTCKGVMILWGSGLHAIWPPKQRQTASRSRSARQR